MTASRFLRPAFAAVLVAALAGCGGYPDTPGGRAAQERHENFEKLGDAAKAAGDELKKASPEMAALATAAGTINTLATQLPTWFPAGSGPQDGIKKSEARPEAWTKPEEFKAAAARFADAAGTFEAAAKSGDAAASGAAMKALGESCKACHDKFKEGD